MKGIILAGGAGSRLYPLTKTISKQLLPIYDKPMIYYPLATLLEAGIQEILIISTPQDTPRFKELLGNGRQLGIRLEYAIQEKPEGLAQAFIIGEEFIGKDNVVMILGDNLFIGPSIQKYLESTISHVETNNGAGIFCYPVADPQRFGIIEFDAEGNPNSIEEKPQYPKSNYCITGLYCYDNKVVEYAKNLKQSPRGELEISDLNRLYLNAKKLHVTCLQEDIHWLDTGTIESLYEASSLIKNLGYHTGYIEAIAYQKGYINQKEFHAAANLLKASQYGKSLLEIISD